jgi:hypothetical protein
MRLIDESNSNGSRIQYFEGCDFHRIINHPKDGSKGFIVVFIDSYKDACKIFNRDSKIDSIINNSDLNNLDDLNNDFVIIYQTGGFTDIVYKSVKNSIENFKSRNWQSVAGNNISKV